DPQSGVFHNDLWRYDPLSDSWIQKASSPDQHAASQAVYYSTTNKIYNMGGFVNSSQATNVTRIYDIATDTWSAGAPMPQAFGNMATMLWGGVVYLAGGNTAFFLDTLYAYDIAGDTWTDLASMPQALVGPGFGAIDGKLYIAGGSNGSVVLNTLYIYEIGTNTWTMGANLPQAVAWPGSAVFNGKLYLYGGEISNAPRTLTDVTQVYDPVANT